MQTTRQPLSTVVKSKQCSESRPGVQGEEAVAKKLFGRGLLSRPWLP